MAATRRAPARTAAAPARRAPAPETTRLSCGSVWATSNPSFLAGSLRPAQGQYSNQQPLLDLLPEAPEGLQWRVKMYASRSTSPQAPVWDIVLELEEVYQR